MMNGRYQPMFDKGYHAAAAEWIEGFKNFVPTEECRYFWEYDGGPPDEEFYRPDWSDEERTHFQMYETTSEGTPISPVFADVESLCRWLANSGASVFASMTASYEEWLAVCIPGVSVPSAV